MEMDEVLQILASFEKHQLDYALIGAVALNFHGLVRATEDAENIKKRFAIEED